MYQAGLGKKAVSEIDQQRHPADLESYQEQDYGSRRSLSGRAREHPGFVGVLTFLLCIWAAVVIGLWILFG